MSSSQFFPGDRLAGRFQIQRWVARGGMGEIYQAQDLELGKTVAVKVLRPALIVDTQSMERFRREIALAHRVTHPNVCRIFDLFYHTPENNETEPSDRIAFLTMELLSGQTLSEFLPPRARLSTHKALPIVRQMVAALEAAHDVGVVHRDFKCSNVMLVDRTERVRVVVTDFGLARSTIGTGRARDVTGQGELIGSPAYMAPEQVAGGEITSATDIYALGVVIYRMVTGRLPYEGSTPMAMLVQRTQGPPPRPQQLVEDLDPRWDAAIRKCMAEDPGERFTSPRELLEALEPEDSAPKSMAILGSRTRQRFAAGALAVALGALGMAVHWLTSEPQDPREISAIAPDAVADLRSSVAVLGFKNLSGKPETAWLSNALAELLTTELAASEQLRTIPGEQVARMRRDLDLSQLEVLAPDTLQQIRRYLGSEYVVLGSYLAVDLAGENGFRLDIRIQSTVTEQTITLSETARAVEILSLVDRLGVMLRDELGISPEDTSRTMASMPSSPLAAQLYTAGLDKLRAFDMLGARDTLLEAIEVDPKFPLARAALAEAYSTLGYDTEAVTQIRGAFELSQDSPRQERMLIEGNFRELTGDLDGAVRSYASLFELFPDNLDYGLYLAQTQRAAGRSEEAEATLENLQRLRPPLSADPRIDLFASELALDLSQFQRSLEAAEQAIEKSHAIGARLLVARSKIAAGNALWSLGRLDEAEQAGRDAHRMSLELGDLVGAGRGLNVASIACSYRNDFESALSAQDQALALYRKAGYRLGIFAILTNQANALESLGDFETTADMREEALGLARSLGVKDYIVISLSNLAHSRRLLGDSAAALRLDEEGLDIARQVGHPQKIGRQLLTIALLSMERDLGQARARLHEATEIFRESDLQADLADALRGFARLEVLEDDFESARAHLETASKIRHGIEQETGDLENRYYYARIAHEEGRSKEAIDIARDLVVQWGPLNHPYDEAEALALLALSRLATGEFTHVQESLERIAEVVPDATRGVITVHLEGIEARLLASQGQPDSALDQLDLELVRHQTNGRLDRQLETRWAMGDIELQHGHVASGLERLDALAKDAESAGFHLIARKARSAIDRAQPDIEVER